MAFQARHRAAYRLQPGLRCGRLAARPGGRQRRRARPWRRGRRVGGAGACRASGLAGALLRARALAPAAAGGVAGAGRVWEAGTSLGEQSPGLHATRCGRHAREVQVSEAAAGDPGRREGGCSGTGRAPAPTPAPGSAPSAGASRRLEAPLSRELGWVHLDLRLWFFPRLRWILRQQGTEQRGAPGQWRVTLN